MCFNLPMTAAFTIIPIFLGLWVMSGTGLWKGLEKWQRWRISGCFWYFSLMEFIQVIEYLTIDDCNNMYNFIFTALGYLHICFQPFFANLSTSAVDSKNMHKERDHIWKLIFKLNIFIGLFMACRMIYPWIAGEQHDNSFLQMCDNPSIEGVCGEKTCSRTGRHHIMWKFRMLQPSFAFPGTSTHFIGMFIMPLALGLYESTAVLFITGPLLAAIFGGKSAGERAAIWCFFSIAESFVTVLTQLHLSRKAAKKAK